MGLLSLLRNCRNFQEITLSHSDDVDIIELFKWVAEALKHRVNADISLLIRYHHIFAYKVLITYQI